MLAYPSPPFPSTPPLRHCPPSCFVYANLAPSPPPPLCSPPSHSPPPAFAYIRLHAPPPAHPHSPLLPLLSSLHSLESGIYILANNFICRLYYYFTDIFTPSERTFLTNGIVTNGNSVSKTQIFKFWAKIN